MIHHDEGIFAHTQLFSAQKLYKSPRNGARMGGL